MGSNAKGRALQRSVSNRGLLVRTALVTLCGMTAYEVLKDIFLHGQRFPRVESQIITVLFTSVMATVAAYCIDRKLSSESRVEHARLNTFLEHIPDAVYFKDRDSRFVRLSRTVATQFGLDDPAQAINKTDFDFFSSEHAEQAFADEQEIIRSGESITGKEEKETWPDGHETWALTTKVPLRDQQGQIVGTMGISHNITDRKRAEGELQEYKAHLEKLVEARTKELSRANEQLQQDISARERAEEALRGAEVRYRILVEQIPAVPYVAEAGEEGEWSYVSPKIESMLGFSPAEWMTDRHRWFQQVHPEDREAVLAAEKVSEARGEAFHSEYRMFARDGRVVWVHDAAALVLDAPGGRALQHGVLFDISERKRGEQELASKAEELKAAKEAAEAASETKSAFLATMSHEIRTPMNGILGMTELVLDTEMTIEQRDSLGLVKLSAESLLTVINDILDFSKIEAGKLSLESIPFDLRGSLSETMKALSFRAHQKSLELVFEVQADLPEALFGDPGRIRQILVNLVGNSIKFTERGEILVSVERGAETSQMVELHFAIKDTGVGVPADKQQKIFEAFSQADGSMARKYGGTGLGLTISTKLVEMMHGRIWVESEMGKGSTFHFTASLGVQENPPLRPNAPQPEQLRDLHVLIVDDNFTNRRVLHGQLTRWGMRPTAVEGGRAALKALQIAKSTGHPFPLILLDGGMPDMDGFALAEEIQKDAGFLAATIMMLTSEGYAGDAARCRELGISAYLLKPIGQTELLAGICQVLNKGSETKNVPLVTRHTLRENKQRYRVLLAEDNAVNQTLAVRLLEKRGYSVIVAGDGRTAVEAFEKGQFDVVLMDIQMPGMDGFAATAAMREKEKFTGGHIPIIAMTAHALKSDKERCISAGMDGYVTKPIHTSELFSTIESVLAKNGYGPANDGAGVADPTVSRTE